MNPRESVPLVPGSIGEILIALGRLTTQQAALVLEDQKRTGQPFGEAAVRLRLVSPDDIRNALSSQFRYPFLEVGSSAVKREVIAAYNPFSPEVEALRGVRARIILRGLAMQRKEKAIAVVSPGHGDGRSFLTSNLAVVFAQLGERTLVIDGDLRKPDQHRLFGLENREGLSSVLAGRSALAQAIQKVPNLNLSVLTSGPLPPNPQELLLGPALVQLLSGIAKDFDIVLVDTPAATNADAFTLGARTGAALLVVSRNKTPLGPTRQLKDSLEHSGCQMIGAVMNSAQ